MTQLICGLWSFLGIVTGVVVIGLFVEGREHLSLALSLLYIFGGVAIGTLYDDYRTGGKAGGSKRLPGGKRETGG